MPVTQRLLVHDNTEDCQVLRMDSANRFIVNDSSDWQFLFGPNSEPSNSVQILKIAAQLDPVSLDAIRFTAYLYNPTTGNADSAATCVFNVYKVNSPGWQDVFLSSFSGAMQPNSYFYASQLLSTFSPTEFDGGVSIMIEVVVTRLGNVYRDRVYINHLGVYDSVIRLQNAVTFLELTKLDE
jgi:hypothetical protein